MPAILLPGRRTDQPSNARASDLALANGCGALLLPTSTGWSDSLNMLSVTGGAGSPATVANASGVARSYASSADFLQDYGLLDPTEGYAWIMHGTLVSSGGNWGGIIARTRDNSTAGGWGWQKNGSGNLVIYHGDFGQYDFGPVSPLVDGLPHTLMGLWRTGSNELELWRDGALYASGKLSAAPEWLTGQGQVKLFASRDTSTFTGTASMVGLCTGNIDQATASELSANPWQLFGGRRALYFGFGGAGGTLVDAAPGVAAAAGKLASISQGITIAVGIGNAEASGLPASLSTGSTIETTTGDAHAAGLTAGISAAATIAATRGDAAAAGLHADVAQGAVVTASAGAASAAGWPATIAQAVTIATSVGNAAAAALTAAIEAGGAGIVCTVGDSEARGLVAAIAAGVTVRASVGSALAWGLPASVSSGAAIHAQVGTAMAAALQAHIVAPVTISCGYGDAEAAGLDCLIETATQLVPTPGYTIARSSRAWNISERARTWRIQ